MLKKMMVIFVLLGALSVISCKSTFTPKREFYPPKFYANSSKKVSFKGIYELIEIRGSFFRRKRGKLLGYIENNIVKIRGLKNEKIMHYIYDEDLNMKGYIINEKEVFKLSREGDAEYLGSIGMNGGILSILDYSGRYEIDEAEVLSPID